MNPLLHLLAILATAVAAGPLLRRAAPRCSGRLQLVVFGAVVLAAVTPLPAWVFGKEGLAEACTEGLLLAICIRAGRERQILMALAAFVLLAEELDYGQVLLGFETPAFLRPQGSRSTQLNYHNFGMAQSMFRLVPAALVLMLATRRFDGMAERFRLPTLDVTAKPALVLSIAAAVLVGTLHSHDRVADELVELLAVGVVANAWRLQTSPASAEPAAGGGVRSTTSS